MNRGQTLCLIGGISLLFGALLPWATVRSLTLGLSLSKAGYEGDGIITGGFGLLLLIGAVVSKGKPGKTYSVVATILATLAGLASFSALTGVSGFSTGDKGLVASVGPGILLSLAGAVIALVGGLQTVPTNLGATPTPPPTSSNAVLSPEPTPQPTAPIVTPSLVKPITNSVPIQPPTRTANRLLMPVVVGTAVLISIGMFLFWNFGPIASRGPDPISLAPTACMRLLRQQYGLIPAGNTPDLAATRSGDDYTVTGIFLTANTNERLFVTCNLKYDGKEFGGTATRN